MPRILAIDWDRREARALLLNSGPTGVSVAGAWAAPLATADQSAPAGKQIGTRLAAAMSGHNVNKAVTIIGVGRDNVQMQLLSLPPAPADELPDMVRFQAEREFTTLGSDAALDFVPISGNAQTPNQVLAVALAVSGINEARELVEPLELEADRITLRASAAAALVQRAGIIQGEAVALIVNPLSDEADLTVLAGDTIVLMRTVRLPEVSHLEGRQRALLGEIRRTMAAVRQQLTDRNVDQVVICGTSESFAQAGSLEDELDVPVALFDVATQAPSNLNAQGVAAESLSRFAAVLGMALNEADRRAPAVDFLHVRRRAETRRFTRKHVLAAAAAAAVLLLVGTLMWQRLAEPTRELAELEAKIKDLESQAAVYKDVTSDAQAIERWLATDVNWLDELELFARRVRPEPIASKEFPVDEDVVISQLTMLRPPGNDAVGGRIDVQARAKGDAAVRALEQRLSDERHRVSPGGVQSDTSLPGYLRLTDLQIQVTPPEDEVPPPAEAKK